MNNLLKLTILNNHYYGMRHGESLANVEGLIVSTPENGVPKYGLSKRGKIQVEQSVKQALVDNMLDSTIRIISSDFKRAHESAEIAKQLLSSNNPIILDAKLRERDFGDFELLTNIHYQTVWDNDAVNSAHTIDNAESADSVMQRATSLVTSLESKYSGEALLLVAHGDTLQILQTAFQKYPASKQRELPHLETAEIRKLELC